MLGLIRCRVCCLRLERWPRLLPACPGRRRPASPPSPRPRARRRRATKRVYTPADFARFAPKTAYDMLAQVPSFTIRTPDRR